MMRRGMANTDNTDEAGAGEQPPAEDQASSAARVGELGPQAPTTAKLEPEVEWVPNFPRIRALDAAWYRVEQYACGIMFLIMCLAVFFAAVSGKFVARQYWSDVLILFGLVYLGTRTRVIKEGETKPSQARSLVVSLLLTAAVVFWVRWFTYQYPSGVPNIDKIATVMMLWVSLLGASLATYERAHLSLEMGEKLWPARMLHLVKAFAHAVTSAFCIALLVLSWHVLMRAKELETVVEPVQWLPVWFAMLILPYLFIIMTVRLLAQSYTLATKKDSPLEEQIPT